MPNPTEVMSIPAVPPDATVNPLSVWAPPVALVTAALYGVSLVFPTIAGLSRHLERFPRWFGPLDVTIAFAVALRAVVLITLTQGRVLPRADTAAYRVSRALTPLLLVACVVLMQFGDRIVLSQCITGFLWRAWLLFYGLPAWFTAMEPAGPGRPRTD